MRFSILLFITIGVYGASVPILSSQKGVVGKVPTLRHIVSHPRPPRNTRPVSQLKAKKNDESEDDFLNVNFDQLYEQKRARSFKPHPYTNAPTSLRSNYSLLDFILNSGYIYALDLKVPDSINSRGAPGMFKFNAPGVPDSLISELHQKAYFSGFNGAACGAIKHLLKGIDGLNYVDKIPFLQIDRPMKHYIAVVIAGRNIFNFMTEPHNRIMFFRLNANGVWSMKPDFREPRILPFRLTLDESSLRWHLIGQASTLVRAPVLCGFFEVPLYLKDKMARALSK